jgi:predicted nucleotidyltransferase
MAERSHEEAMSSLSWRRHDVEEEVLLRVLDEVVDLLENEDVPYLFIGGIASALLGRPRTTQDIDLFVKPEDADRVLEALEGGGFQTHKPYPHWLYKAVKDDVLVDVIFRSTRDILLDEEMLARAEVLEFKGRKLRMVPPEDLLVMKAIANTEDTPRYWHDALSVIGRSELDWDYLIARARRYGIRRILSLLLYAQSNDLVVPERAVRALFDALYGPVPDR